MKSPNLIAYRYAPLRVVLLIACLLSAISVSQAQNASGYIDGQVIDTDTQEPLLYAHITIQELNRSTATHHDGHFHFSNVPAGEYSLRTTFMGFQPNDQTIEIQGGDTLTLVIELSATSLRGQEVQVIGQVSKETGAGLENASKSVSGAELRQQLGTTLSQTLTEIPGFDQRSMGAAPSRPVIRGLGGKRVMILQDGERTGDISAQSSDHAVTVDPSSAEQIEIARGPSALAYGSNAIGGVINVVREQIATDVFHHLHGSVSAQGQSVSPGGVAGVELNIPAGKWAIQVDANGRYADDTYTPVGRLDNSYIRQTNNSLGVSYIHNRGYIGAAGSMFISHYGIPPNPEGGHENGVDIEMQKVQTDLRSEYNLDHPFLSNLQGNASFKRYNHKEIESSGAVGTEYDRASLDGSLRLRHRSIGPLSKGSIGVWGLIDDYAVFGANTPDALTNRVGTYWIEHLDEGPLHLEVGFRYDFYQAIPEDNSVSPVIGNIRDRTFQAVSSSVSARYNISSKWYTTGTFLHSFRPPSVEELYSEGPHLAAYSFEVGNPDLDAERGLAKELTIGYSADRLQFELTGYHNSFGYYIYPRNTGQQSSQNYLLDIYQYEGVEALLTGFEAYVNLPLTQEIALETNASYTYGRRELFDNEETTQSGSYQPLPLIPPLKGIVKIKYDKRSFQGGIKSRWAATQNRTGDFETSTDGYLLFDLYGRYRIQQNDLLHTISLNITNLFNTEYRSHLSRIKDIQPEAGINVQLLYRLYF
ncbi:MAG: TonB-dependent receptor [Bacteroidota bacterium]